MKQQDTPYVSDFDPAPGEQASPNGSKPKRSMRDRLLNIDGLANLPKPKPLISGVLDVGTLALLLGYRGRGKSFIAIDWGLRVATGTHWFGNAAQKTRVLYIAGEGATGIYQRVATWQAWNNIQVNRDQFIVHNGAINLFETGSTTELASIVADDGFGLVIVDTLARCAVGAEENSAKDMGVFVANLDTIRTAGAGRCTVLTVHHAGLGDKERSRGSTALEAAMDTVHAAAGDMPGFVMSNTKAKDRAEAKPMKLRLTRPDGLPSCIIEQEQREQVADDSLDDLRQRKLMSEICVVLGAAKEPLGKNELMDRVKGQAKDIRYAMAALIDGGYVTVEEGANRKQIHTLVKAFEVQPS